VPQWQKNTKKEVFWNFKKSFFLTMRAPTIYADSAGQMGSFVPNAGILAHGISGHENFSIAKNAEGKPA
jgi:hypothetical protein